MSRQKNRGSEVAAEEVKDLLDKEQLCLLKAKAMIQQQMKVLQAEAATIQRLISVQEQPRSSVNGETVPVTQGVDQEGVDQDPSSRGLPQLNLAVIKEPKQGGDGEMETDSESGDD